MSLIQLPLVAILKERMRARKPLIQIVRGPRQVGKTTSLEQFTELKEFKGKTHFVSADGMIAPTWIDEQWQIAHEQKKILIIDEIQKIPRWDEVIKRLWDDSQRKKRFLKCILTGSSSLTLQKGMTESLTGRFEEIPVTHWDFEQSKLLNKKIDLQTYLRMGGYPGSYGFFSDPKRWSHYIGQSVVETVIGKDILFQTTVRSPALFRQSFHLLCSYPAQVVSYNKILGQLQDKGNIDLVRHYIELYEAAYLLKTIPKFYKNEIKKKSSSPKIIIFAPALVTYHRINNVSPELEGRIFESYVGRLLLNNGFDPYYWAEGDHELDFILEYKSQIVVLEVKSGKIRHSSSFEVFRKKYPTAKLIFIDKSNLSQFSRDIGDFLERRL